MIDGALRADSPNFFVRIRSHVPAIDPLDNGMLLVAALNRIAPPLLAPLPDLLVLRLEHRVGRDLLPTALALHSVLGVARMIATGALDDGLTCVDQR